jgi:hypothetical protein
MKKHKIAVAAACVVFFTAAWGAIAAGATFTRELAQQDEPWGPGKVFLLLGPTHGQVVGEVTSDSGLVAGDSTQIYLSHVASLGDLRVSVEGPISIYTFDPDPANPPASYDPVNGDVFHLVTPGVSFTVVPRVGEFGWTIGHAKPELVFPDLGTLFNFDNAALADGLSWRPMVTPGGDLDLLVVPEPGTFLLLISGGLGVLVWGRRRRSRRSERRAGSRGTTPGGGPGLNRLGGDSILAT